MFAHPISDSVCGKGSILFSQCQLWGDTLVVRISMSFKRQGGRKRILAPDPKIEVGASKGLRVPALALFIERLPMRRAAVLIEGTSGGQRA